MTKKKLSELRAYVGERSEVMLRSDILLALLSCADAVDAYENSKSLLDAELDAKFLDAYKQLEAMP